MKKTTIRNRERFKARMFLLEGEFCPKCKTQLRRTKLGNKWCVDCNINLGDD